MVRESLLLGRVTPQVWRAARKSDQEMVELPMRPVMLNQIDGVKGRERPGIVLAAIC